ncbi:hypothetical protein F1193_00065 [Blastochloris sulfoviridis]|uniref:Exopolysaccharide Pel transporter PelG n=2 Tax=Blastochloris sulfoviridis TaxID=50712 RepID=A0A5M6I6M2_9HYPH|nr:hypothetical protein F1193_00065 [Blastochloris sulfoviridis]
MTSINQTLEAMTRQPTLTSIALAYLYSALIVAGPWIFTVLGLVGLSMAPCGSFCDQLPVFRSIVIYNSAFALIATSPLAFLCGRYVSGNLHEGRHETIMFALAFGLLVFAVVVIALAAPFYLFATTLQPSEKIAAIQNVALIGASWLLVPFCSVLRAHNTVLVAFGVSSVAMFLGSGLLHDPSVTSLLSTLNAGFAITDAIMLVGLVRRLGPRMAPDEGLVVYLRRMWEIPAAGLAFALGLWIDKIIMWHAAPADNLIVASVLRTMPSYDTAMFWAQLSAIPVISVFFVHVETRFSSSVERAHERLRNHASLREIKLLISHVRTAALSGIVTMFSGLVIIGILVILSSFVFMNELGLRPSYMGALRTAVIATTFYTSAMFCFYFLMHFDLRRQALVVVVTYAVLNASLTLVFVRAGEDFYGYGNLLASAIGFLFSFAVLLRELSWLPFHVFVTNNASVR